jgi:hypothetical protein
MSAATFPAHTYLYNLIEQNSNDLTHALLVTQNNVLPLYVNLQEAPEPAHPRMVVASKVVRCSCPENRNDA